MGSVPVLSPGGWVGVGSVDGSVGVPVGSVGELDGSVDGSVAVESFGGLPVLGSLEVVVVLSATTTALSAWATPE